MHILRNTAMLPRLQEIIILHLGAVFLPSLVFSGGSMFVFKVKKFKKCSAVHKVKGKRVLLALSSIHSTWAYFSAEILSRLLCLYVMHEGHFLLFTADAQFIHILKKKEKKEISPVSHLPHHLPSSLAHVFIIFCIFSISIWRVALNTFCFSRDLWKAWTGKLLRLPDYFVSVSPIISSRWHCRY